MRTVHINFLNTENQLPDGNILGNQGEHNATVLAVTPPAEMTANENITSYRIAFELSNCRAVRSKDIAKTDVVFLPLFSQITSSETVAVQLEGYDDNGDVIVKSPKIKKLKFNPSVCGIKIPPSDSPNSMAAEVAANTSFRKKFSENESGELTYNGETIGGNASAAMKTANVPLGMFTILPRKYGDEFVLYDFPDDAEIHTVRFLYNQQWIDIRNLHMIDGIPYTLNMGKSYVKQDEGVIAVAFIGHQTIIINGEATVLRNFIAEAIESYEVSEIEIDYYENTKG